MKFFIGLVVALALFVTACGSGGSTEDRVSVNINPSGETTEWDLPDEDSYTPFFSSDGRKIAFISRENFYVIDLDKASRQDISVPNKVRSSRSRVEWSPDGGNLIVYGEETVDEGSVYRVDIKEGDFQKLSRSLDIYSFNLSPNGDVVVLYEDNGSLYFTDPNGENLKEITGEIDDAVDVDFMEWSPDGKMFLFRVRTEGLYLIDADGKNLAYILRARDDDDLDSDFIEWSPDSKQVLYNFRGDWYTYTL